MEHSRFYLNGEWSKTAKRMIPASCRVTNIGSSMIDQTNGLPLKLSSCGGMSDLSNNWRMLAKLGSLKSDSLSL